LKLLAAILLTLLLTSPQALADDPPPEDALPAAEAVDEAPAEETPTKGRLRPRTDKEEEEYKKRVVREDPFLNAPPGPDGAQLAFYRPVDYLRFDAPFDSATYLTQDASGKMLGFLTISAEPQPNEPGTLHLTLDYAVPKKHVELWLDTKWLKPRSITKLTPANQPVQRAQPKKGEPSKGKPQVAKPEVDLAAVGNIDGVADNGAQRRTRIEYLFDRVTIEREAGAVSTMERMRQLPYSYDIEQLPLLVRQLDFAKLERHWPFEALLTDPERRRSLPLQIAEPKAVTITSAEPQARACYELQLRVGEQDTWTWWVEREAPHRLVKFTDGVYTYTLHQYDAPSGSY
jgi:hypothetical protein